MAKVCTPTLILYSLFAICAFNMVAMIGWPCADSDHQSTINHEHVAIRHDKAKGEAQRPKGTSGQKPKSPVASGQLDARIRWLVGQARRQSTLLEVCANHQGFGEVNSLGKLTKDKSRFWYFIVCDKYRLVYTWIVGVASPNWVRAFLVLESTYKRVMDVNLAKVGHSSVVKLSSFSRGGITHRLENYTNFIFVENPFVRLLSAYQKTLKHTSYFQKNVGTEIIKKYRPNATAKALTSGADVTFPEFVQYLVNAMPSKLNHHWRPIYKLVFPCTIRFDYIGKLETWNEDTWQILQQTSINHLIRFKPIPGNVSHYQPTELNRYYSQIPSGDLAKLYSMYEPDFQMFGYQIPVSIQAIFQPI